MSARSEVFCYEDENGVLHDREIHNAILRAGDNAAVQAATRRRWKEKYGWSDAEIDELLETNPEVSDADYAAAAAYQALDAGPREPDDSERPAIEEPPDDDESDDDEPDDEENEP